MDPGREGTASPSSIIATGTGRSSSVGHEAATRSTPSERSQTAARSAPSPRRPAGPCGAARRRRHTSNSPAGRTRTRARTGSRACRRRPVGESPGAAARPAGTRAPRPPPPPPTARAARSTPTSRADAHHDADVDGGDDGGHAREHQRLADHDVDVVEAVAQHRDADRDREQPKLAKPALQRLRLHPGPWSSQRRQEGEPKIAAIQRRHVQDQPSDLVAATAIRRLLPVRTGEPGRNRITSTTTGATTPDGDDDAARGQPGRARRSPNGFTIPGNPNPRTCPGENRCRSDHGDHAGSEQPREPPPARRREVAVGEEQQEERPGGR